MLTMPKKIATGRVYQKTYRDRQGHKQKTSTWYLKYYVNGKPKDVSSGTSDYDEALAMLRQRMAQTAQQPEYTDHPERVRMSQLFDMLLEDYRMHGRHSTYDVERKIEKRLRPFFGKMKAQSVTSEVIKQYIKSRLAAKRKPTNSSINRELAPVHRALQIASVQEPPLVLRVPHFTRLPEENVREGTLTHDAYRLVRDSLPGYARVALVIAYHTGTRKGEVRQILKDWIDLTAKRIKLPGHVTKNKKPRSLPIYGDMAAEIEMAVAAGSAACPFLIQNEGKPVFDWEKSWATACTSAGVPGALFHDLRRTALTNMIEGGLSEKEAMEISGHRTRAVFDRYHVVSERRLKEMASKLELHLKAKDEQPKPEKSPVQ